LPKKRATFEEAARNIGGETAIQSQYSVGGHILPKELEKFQALELHCLQMDKKV
jgi:hypothetical protein